MIMQSVVFNYAHFDPTHRGANRTPGGRLSLTRLGDGRQCVAFRSSYADEWTEYHGHWRTLIGNALEINFKYTGRDDALVQHMFYVSWSDLALERQPTYGFHSGLRYYYAFKTERDNGPLHTIYLTQPYLTTWRQLVQPLRLLDTDADLPADDGVLRSVIMMDIGAGADDWVLLEQEHWACDDDEVMNILSNWSD